MLNGGKHMIKFIDWVDIQETLDIDSVIFIDSETTHADPKNAKIIQLSALVIDKSNNIKEYDSKYLMNENDFRIKSEYEFAKSLIPWDFTKPQINYQNNIDDFIKKEER